MEITAEELIAAVEAGDAVDVLDVRASQRLADGRIDLVAPERFHNIRGSKLLGYADVAEAGLDPATPLAVVCGFGRDSLKIAAYLNDQGFRARSLAGGMAAWMEAVVPRACPAPAGLDGLVQFDRVGKGSCTYLLLSKGEAFVIDPPRHTVPILEAIDAAGARLVGVADTHAHADYISGGRVLATALDAPYRLHPADAVSPYDGRAAALSFEPLVDGDAIAVGDARLSVRHTPGHTEGSVSFVLGDGAVFSGDFVFVGSVGRPDLGGKSEEWARALWRSLERARSEWPADAVVYPAHYASQAERNEDRTVGAPFGALAERNEPLGLATEDAFLGWVRERAGAFPERYRRIKTINLGLETVDDTEASELEAGRNACALG